MTNMRFKSIKYVETCIYMENMRYHIGLILLKIL